MRIKKLNLYHLALPFSGEFSLSIRKGLMSQTVILELVGENPSIRGYGEGIPIASVTGETPESVIRDVLHFTADPLFPWELGDISRIWDFVDIFPGKKHHNAAICALEMALLDMLGKVERKSVVEYFPRTHLTDVVHYGAPVPLGDRNRISMFCGWIKALGIKRVRVKMGSNHDQNRRTLETVVSGLGNGCELRIDPNGIWDRQLAFKHLPIIIEHGVDIVEEPLKRDAPGFREFADALFEKGITLMACESAPTLMDVEHIMEEGFYQMINIKLCRSGGYRRAFQMIDAIRKSPLSFQIGCTLGESGILSAAGRALCLLSKDAVNFDGSYDRFLLKENTTTENVSFGPEGRAGPLGGYGLGVHVNERNLKELAVSSIITAKAP